MSRLKTIGVLGGMGPAATAAFQQRVIDLTQAHDDADHVPLLINMNPQIPSRIQAIMDHGETPAPTLIAMAKTLERSGAQAIVMPCNTAHFYARQIEQAITIPFLNMLTLSAAKLRQKLGPARIGMLASPLTDDIGIFRAAFAPFDLDVMFPKNADYVLSIIRTIKATGINDEMGEVISGLGRDLQEKGVDALLMGCSEFSLLQNKLSTKLPVFDTVDILAMETIRFSGAKAKPQT